MIFTFQYFIQSVSNHRDPDEVGATAENVDCEGWKLIQRRDEYGNPEDFFSSKLWND